MEAYLRKQGVFKKQHLVWSFGRSFALAAVVVLVVSVSVSSYAYASDAVLPDTVLYPIRQVVEEVQVTLAVTPVQKEKVQQKIEERRVKEVQKLTELKRIVPVKLEKYVKAANATTTRAIQERIEKKERQQAEQKQKKEEQKQEKLEQKQLRLKEKQEAANNKQKAEREAKKATTDQKQQGQLPKQTERSIQRDRLDKVRQGLLKRLQERRFNTQQNTARQR